MRAELLADDASAEIDAMLDDLRELRGQVRDARRTARRQATADDAAALVADRLYERAGEIYRTVLSGAGNLYAKIWTGEGWEYAAGAIRDLRPEHRMSVERAKELSIRFARCIRCGATAHRGPRASRPASVPCASPRSRPQARGPRDRGPSPLTGSCGPVGT